MKTEKELQNLLRDKAAHKRFKGLRALFHGRLTKLNIPETRGFRFDEK